MISAQSVKSSADYLQKVLSHYLLRRKMATVLVRSKWAVSDATQSDAIGTSSKKLPVYRQAISRANPFDMPRLGLR
jgi:hypothetical protein